MTTLDGFFRGPVDLLSHPRLKSWRARLEHGADATLELHRPETALGFLPIEMNVHFSQEGKQEPLETLDWDDDLNSGLIQLGVKAIKFDQEAGRFSLGLRRALRPVEREFGDGYLNAVIIDLIRDSDLTRYKEIQEVLEHAYANPPCNDSERCGKYDRCREMIADAISGRAHELKDKLGYTEDNAKQILVQAIASYLDDRFSVTNRRRMGLL